MQVFRWGGIVGWCCLLGLVFLSSCRREQPSSFDSNLAPDTYISFAPAESSLAYYRVHLFWNGVDPDGAVDHYEFAVTDTNKTPGEDTPGFNRYFRTDRTDSLFVFTANLPQILGHRFYVRAVDNDDRVDPTPAWAYFVAHDFNFPNVVWHTSRGSWTDRAGNLRTRLIRSNNIFEPTDTIGVAGNTEFSWSGFDVDEGGFVTGYAYRVGASTNYTGGTLSDTTVAVSHVPAPGKPYFSGREVVFVRSIDDAGAATNPDSVRSYVVNFSPITWVVDPNSPQTPTRRVSFIDKDTQKLWPSGTFLADGSRSIRFQYVGFDDSRDISLDPTNPTGITGFQFRKLKNGGGTAFQNISNFVKFPQINDFDRIETQSLTSGTYEFQVRAKDELGRFGNPERVIVGVNYFPYFTSVTYLDAAGDEQPLWVPGSTTPVQVRLTKRPDGTYPNLIVRYLAVDDHRPGVDKHPLDGNLVVEEELGLVGEYRSQMNGARDGFERAVPDVAGQKSFEISTASSPPSGTVKAGQNTLELTARDTSGRDTKLFVFFDVRLE